MLDSFIGMVIGQELRLEYIEGAGLICSDCKHGYSSVYVNVVAFVIGSASPLIHIVSRFEFHYFSKYCFRKIKLISYVHN